MNIYSRVVGSPFDFSLGSEVIPYFKNGQPWVLSPHKYYELNNGKWCEVWKYTRFPVRQKTAYRRKPEHQKKEVSTDKLNQREWKKRKKKNKGKRIWGYVKIGKEGKKRTIKRERKKVKQLIHHEKYEQIDKKLGIKITDSWYYT